MNEQRDAQVIVIGAGIAGLTAAWQLKKAGVQVLVLEAEPLVGGRMQSIQVDDALIDCGAQFLSSAYSVIPKLIKEMGLTDQLIPTTPWAGLVNNNGIALVHPKKPWLLVFHRILSIGSVFRLLFNQVRLFNFRKKSFALNDITRWTQYDNQSAAHWVMQYFGEPVARELTSAIFNGFYFQSLSDSSAAMVAAVLAFSAHNPLTMALMTGMGSLPKKLADQLDVKTGVSVSSIFDDGPCMKVTSSVGEFSADHVIVAVPAPIAKNIIQQSDEQTSLLFGTPYSSSIVISLLTHPNWLPPPKIASAYGFLVNPNVNSKIAALTIENNKCHTRKKQGYLINIMLSDQCAKKLMHLTDEEICVEIQVDVESILPAIYANLHGKKICRWPYAMPCTPIGRAKAVKEYRDTRNKNHKIWMAGDYLGFPWTDSAAQTGLWAADQVIQAMKNGK